MTWVSWLKVYGLLLALALSSTGCELIAAVDRSETGAGGAGGAVASGGGGMGGMAASGGGGAGGGMPCDPATCPAASSECVDVICKADGTCGESPKADGPTGTQIKGDCKQNVCKGGVVVAENDDLDAEDDGNECTDNTCANGMKVTTSTPVNTACGAGAALYCDGKGACVGCTDAAQCGMPSNECLTATCMAGLCGTANKPDGTGCNDGDACSQTDTCQAGACVGTNPVTCIAQDQCHNAGTCDSATGICSNPAKADGAGCNDGDACSQTDTCQAGACVGTNPVTCIAQDQCHNAGTCDSATGTCSNPAKADGTGCNDGDACSQTDTCQAGACVGANPLTCAFGVVCAAGSCMYDPITYIKASNTDGGDSFGYTVALSADGNTLAVGAYQEASNATGINGNQSDNSASASGAVYVFTYSGGAWSQQAYIKASNTGADDDFGLRLALSGDGNTLAVGAYYEDSNATSINGNQGNNSAGNSGAVYVFTRSGGAWSQQAYVKASNTDVVDYFGYSVALSGDGNTLAVGAPNESSNATGINGTQGDNSAPSAGAIYVFTRSGGAWSQQAYVKASNTGAGDGFGYSVALSGDGNTLAVAAFGEDSNATGISGNQGDNSANASGAVYVFTRSGGAWSQQAYVKASNTGANDAFGWSVALSGDGNTLAVGAYYEDSNATGINGDQANNSATDAGAVYVFTRSGGAWSQQAYVKASNTAANDRFGHSVSLSADGTTLAVGANLEDSNATGIGGNQGDNSALSAGAVYVFTRSGGAWSQQAYVKASNTGAADFFGESVALSGDGTTLAVGASEEDSNATGIGGNQADNSVFTAGAVYVY